jgi:hypothetical protein
LEESQTFSNSSLAALRLPSSIAWRERIGVARAWLNAQQPHWVSLQFVAYGYHPKGFVRGLHRELCSLFADRNSHLMLHEIWIGIQRDAALIQKLMGSFQSKGVLRLIHCMNPAVIHTSNTTYQALLRHRGVEAAVLPLIGNIPVVPPPERGWLDRELSIRGIHGGRHGSWRFGLFGSVHSNWSPEPLFGLIDSAAKREGFRVVIASIGRLGPGAARWREIVNEYKHCFQFAELGERDASEISTFLQSVDFGIALTPWQLIGKSGTATSMLDHGLPVIVAGRDEQFARVPPAAATDGLHPADSDLPNWLRAARRVKPREHRLEIAAKFVEDLGQSQIARDVGTFCRFKTI